MCLKQWLAHNNYYATIFFSFSLISLKNMEKEKGKKVLKITYIALRILVCTRNKFSIFFILLSLISGINLQMGSCIHQNHVLNG